MLQLHVLLSRPVAFRYGRRCRCQCGTDGSWRGYVDEGCRPSLCGHVHCMTYTLQLFHHRRHRRPTRLGCLQTVSFHNIVHHGTGSRQRRARCVTWPRAMTSWPCWHNPIYTPLATRIMSHPATVTSWNKKVKFSHTRYQALGPEPIPVYRQSARRWLKSSLGGRLPLLSAIGLRSPSQSKNVTVLRPVPSYTACWQRHVGGNNLPKVVTQLCDCANWTHNLLIASPTLYRYVTMPPLPKLFSEN